MAVLARFSLILFVCIISFSIASAQSLTRHFEIYKLIGNNDAPTLLLMGGIHGDEPGAYYTSDFFLRHYKITKGNVWVVPVVNPHSMFANVRGLYGDMNRKFAALERTDPDYEAIEAIKALLAHKDIDISLHLHDGSGYWRPHYVNALLNQHRWGNCSVIDQPHLDGVRYGNIASFVAQMVADINANIHTPLHKFHVNNTNTKASNNIEQLKALTFFSLSLGKPALTNEASKELPLHTRVYYHLLAIESLLGQLGISFERDFELNESRINELISPALFSVEIENRIILPIDSLRPRLGHFPLPKNIQAKDIKLHSPSHLFGLLKHKNGSIELKYGSKTLSTLLPQWQTFDKDKMFVKMNIDGEIREVELGSMVFVKDYFEILNLAEHRVNIIGYVKPNDTSSKPNESGIRIYKNDIQPRFSIDTKALVYRAEVYRGELFSGMITISFDMPKSAPQPRYYAVTYTPAKIASLDTNANYVKHTAQSTPERESKPSQIIKPKRYIVRTDRGVNVRDKPNVNSNIIAKLPKGTFVDIESNADAKWLKRTDNKGYVIASALSVLESSPTAQLTSQTTQSDKIIESTSKTASSNLSKARVNVALAIVREHPSTQSSIVAKAPLGREMQILRYVGNGGIDGSEWVQIHYIFKDRHINGYIARRLVKEL